MPDNANGANDDLKAKMREALAKKEQQTHGRAPSAEAREKAHGSEVPGGVAPKMKRRPADRGGGGS